MIKPPIPIVDVPTTTSVAAGANKIEVPDTVMGGPPGISVCVPYSNSDAEFAVKVEPAIVRTARLEWGYKGTTEVPIMTAELSKVRGTGVLWIVIEDAPDVRVCVPIMTSA